MITSKRNSLNSCNDFAYKTITTSHMRKFVQILPIFVCTAILASCTVYKGLKYGNAAVDDYTIFEQEVIKRGAQTFHFAECPKAERVLDTMKVNFYSAPQDSIYRMSISEAMEKINKPAAALIIKNDTIVYEHYHGGWDKNTQSCIFSVTKTITSMLCGIALKEGYIKSINDPVTDYIPELKKKDPLFDSLRIEHLLDMTAGLKFNENYSWNPFSKMARLYMGNNAMKVVKGMTFSHKPGEHYHYDSMTSQILGIVIERATGRSYAKYLSEKVWQPLGMEQDASMGLDSKKHRVSKSYGGFSTNVRDLAKVGRLYLNVGNWNGTQIMDTAFVARSLSTHMSGKKNKNTYSYSWYWGVTPDKWFSSPDSLKAYYKNPHNLPEGTKYCGWRSQGKGKAKAILHQGGYWGFGLYGQVLYINPRRNIIGVFLGADRFEDFQYVVEKVMNVL